MSDSQDKVPVWVGRAVRTSDLPADLDDLTKVDVIDNNVIDTDVTDNNVIDTDVTDNDVIDNNVIDAEVGQITSASVDLDRLEIPTQPVAFAIEAVPSLPEDEFDSSRYGNDPRIDDSMSITPMRDVPRRSPFGLLVAVLAVALVALAAVAFQAGWLDGNDSSDTEAASTDDDLAVDDSEAGDAADTVDPEPNTTADSGTDQPTTGEVLAGVDGEADVDMVIPGMAESTIEAHRQEAIAAGESAWAIYTEGKLYLQGQVPSMAIGREISTRLQGLLGAGNVVEQFEIEPTVAEPSDPPLFIKETVVFAPNETTMPPGSDWILVVADVLMKRYGNTTLTVIANTSGPVDPGDDPDLPRLRADTIIEYLVEGGIDRSRLDYELREDVDFGPDTGNEAIEFAVRGLLE